MSLIRSVLRAGGGRFAAVVIGAALASLVWIVVVMATTKTPGEARAERASPDLPPPTAVLQKTSLTQVSWFDCSRGATSLEVTAPAVPPGYRPVVTSIALPGTPIETGTVLAQVAGQPLIAVVTDAVFYRDLTVGARGSDARGLEDALAAVSVIQKSDGVMDAATIRAWNKRFDKAGPNDRIRVSTLVAVPADGLIGAADKAVGDRVVADEPLLEVDANSTSFTCSGVDPGQDLPLSELALEVDGQSYAVTAVDVPSGDDESLVDISVQPAGDVSGDSARLGITHAASAGAVLTAPLSAVKVAADGKASVVVVEGGRQRQVPVQLGVTAQGLVEVEGAGLAEGVEVRLFDFDPSATGNGPAASDAPARS